MTAQRCWASRPETRGRSLALGCQPWRMWWPVAKTARTVHRPPHPLQRRSHKLLKDSRTPGDWGISSVLLWAWLEGCRAVEAFGPQLQLLWVTLLPRSSLPRVTEIVERPRGKTSSSPLGWELELRENWQRGASPCTPVVRSLHFQWKECRFNPWPGN